MAKRKKKQTKKTPYSNAASAPSVAFSPSSNSLSKEALSRRLPDIYLRLRESFSEVKDVQEVFFADHFLTAREANALDTINLIDRTAEKNADGFMQTYNENYKSAFREEKIDIESCRPFLKEGILKYYPLPGVPDLGDIHYLHFNILDAGIDSGQISVQLCEYHKGTRSIAQPGFVFSWLAQMNIDKEMYNFDAILTQDHIYKFSLDGGLLTSQEEPIAKSLFDDYDPTSDEELEPVKASASKALNALLSAFKYMNRLIEERDTIEREAVPLHEEENAEAPEEQIVVKRRSKKNKKKRIIFVGGPIIECGENSQVKTKQNKIIRQTLAWGVRGHYRHYQNGRTIYIKPYVKGPERDSAQPKSKEYRAV